MKILSSKQYGVSLKVTIQGTGKLGFSGPTAEVLKLKPGMYVRFAQDDDAQNTLYLSVMQGEDEDGFKVMNSGGYCNLSTRALFDALDIDYKSYTVIFDLKRTEEKDSEVGGETYRMTPRPMARKSPDQPNDTLEDDE